MNSPCWKHSPSSDSNGGERRPSERGSDGRWQP